MPKNCTKVAVYLFVSAPGNFPLAIFVGQVVAALAAGNSVIAKPAEQTPLIATKAVKLLHEAGVPGTVPSSFARFQDRLLDHN